MKLLRYYVVLLALICQQAGALHEVFFVNNTGYPIGLEYTNPVDRRERKPFMVRQLDKGGMTQYKYKDFGVDEHAQLVAYSIDQMRVVAKGMWSSTYDIDVDTIKAAARTCRSGDVKVSLEPFGWTSQVAPIKVACTGQSAGALPEDDFVFINKPATDPADAAYRELGVQKTATPFQILGIRENAPAAEINDAWKKLTLQWHPDKAPEAKKKIALILMQIINNARESALKISGSR